MKCEIYLWEDRGSVVTTLAHIFIDVDSIQQARDVTRRLLIANESSSTAHYSVPEFWNQNIRTGMISRREALKNGPETA
jgi:hypothetical protein